MCYGMPLEAVRMPDIVLLNSQNQNSMLKNIVAKALKPTIVKACNKYIESKCREYYAWQYDSSTFGKAIGAQGLALSLCEVLGIDPLEISIPEVVIDELRKEGKNAR